MLKQTHVAEPGIWKTLRWYMCHCSPPPRRRRSPSYERSRRRSPSYDRSRRRSPSYDRRRRSPSPPPRRRHSPSPDRHALSHNQQMPTSNCVYAFIKTMICHCIGWTRNLYGWTVYMHSLYFNEDLLDSSCHDHTVVMVQA